jgi:hypothetical protein
MPLKQTLIRKYSGCTSIFTASFSRSSVTALSKAYKRSGYGGYLLKRVQKRRPPPGSEKGSSKTG